MREKRLSVTQRTVLQMLLMDPPSCTVEIKATVQYLSVLADHIKAETEIRKNVWAEQDIALVEGLSESLASTVIRNVHDVKNDVLLMQAQLALIHPSLIRCAGCEDN